MRLCTYLALILVLLFETQAFASPSALTYQGRILKSDGSPLEYNNVSFLFQITNPAGSCIIFQEQVTGYSMVNSGGVFDVPIGSGTVQYPLGASSVLEAFNNSKIFNCGSCTLAGSTYNCVDGSSTYAAVAGDLRRLRVSFYDGSGWKTISPDNVIRSVPYSAYSLSAEKLGTNVASDFVLKTGVPTCSANEFLSWNGSALVCAPVSGAAGGTVTSVASTNSYITVANGTSTPALTLNVGTTAGTVAAGNDSRFTDARTPTGSAGGDLSGTYPNPSVAKIQGVAVSAAAPGSGQFMKYNGTQWAGAAIAMSDVTNLNSSLSNYHTIAAFNSAVGGANCAAHETPSWNSVTGSFFCQTINVSVAGDVSGTIGAVSVNKIKGTAVSGTAPTSAQFLVYNGTTQYAPVSMSGDATMSATGAVTLKNTGTAGTYTKVTTDAQGRVTSGTTLSATDIPALDWSKITTGQPTTLSGYGITDAVQNAGATPSVQTGTVASRPAAGTAGRLYIGSDDNTLYRDTGSAWVKIGDGAGATGVSSVTASAPLASSGGTTPNITITQANSTTNGYLSSTDWNTFNNKLGTASTFSGDVSGTSSTTSVDKIKGKSVVPGAYSAGQTLRYDGTNWVNAVLGFSDLSGSASTAQLPTIPVSKGGTGVTSLTANRLLASDGTGSTVTAFNCGVGQLITFNASGVMGCTNYSTSGLFANGGNSFAGTATLGTNDNYALNLATNGTAKMTILPSGYVGIGTSSPAMALDVLGQGTFTSNSSGGFTLTNQTSNDAYAGGTMMTIQNSGTSTINKYINLIADFDGDNGGAVDFGVLTFGANNSFSISNPSGNAVALQASGGNVGIGTTTPAAKLSVAGVIESTSGGIKFPDGTTQSTAGGGGAAAWVTFKGTSSQCPSGVCTINASYNVASVTRLAAGAYRVTLQNALPNTNYVVAISTQADSTSGYGTTQPMLYRYSPDGSSNYTYVAPTTSQFVFGTAVQGVTNGTDNAVVHVIVTNSTNAAAVDLWSQSGNNLFYSTGNVGIGTANPTTALEVSGTVKATNYQGSVNGLRMAGGAFTFASGSCGGSAAAACSINISSGSFTSAPNCTITMSNIDGTSYTEKMVIQSISTTTLKIWKGNYADAGTTMQGQWICIGPG